MDNYLIVMMVVLLGLWLVPAVMLTIKVRSIDGLDPEMKNQLIKPMWYVPLVGNVVCYFMFARLGKLNKLSDSEHRSIQNHSVRR
jgi:hypothetical protein